MVSNQFNFLFLRGTGFVVKEHSAEILLLGSIKFLNATSFITKLSNYGLDVTTTVIDGSWLVET